MSSLPSSAVPAVRSIIYLGMDVHEDSITIAVLPATAKAPTRLERLPDELPKLKKWLARVARDGELRTCYEASWAGYFAGARAARVEICLRRYRPFP